MIQCNMDLNVEQELWSFLRLARKVAKSLDQQHLLLNKKQLKVLNEVLSVLQAGGNIMQVGKVQAAFGIRMEKKTKSAKNPVAKST